MGKRFTIMVVPDRSATVRRFRISKASLLFGLWTLIGFFLLVVGGTVGGIYFYGSVSGELEENDRLRYENLELRSQLLGVHQKVTSVQSILDRVERFDSKLRTITQLHDPDRHLALGPFDAKKDDDLDDPDGTVTDPLVLSIGENPLAAVGLMGKRLEELVSEAERREGSINELEVYLRGQKVRLASTPSIWPTRGWLTSGFGTRLDPYTGKRTMHSGIDIANQQGVSIMAPARGTVTFAGSSGGFGKVIVVDHGFGMRTRYAHLSEIAVQVGDRVKRGDQIAKLGNTGRSTGPHLHYEVEVNGICENPMNYILED
ncbi:MAG: M23 family metallopeptidase [Deltaproteobacteria bacterium]|nr:M23 family metallopeptidase [Deltaproteobacteria bacterium]